MLTNLSSRDLAVQHNIGRGSLNPSFKNFGSLLGAISPVCSYGKLVLSDVALKKNLSSHLQFVFLFDAFSLGEQHAKNIQWKCSILLYQNH